MNNWNLSLECKGVSTLKKINVIYHFDRMNGKKNYMIISKDSVKEFVKIKHPFMLNKNTQQTRNRRNVKVSQHNINHI